MEDQQPAQGYLTVESADRESEAAEAESTVDSEASEAESTIDQETTGEGEKRRGRSEKSLVMLEWLAAVLNIAGAVAAGMAGHRYGAVIFAATGAAFALRALVVAPPRGRRQAGKGSLAAAAAAAVLFVGAAAFAGFAVQPYLIDRATVQTKLRIAQTAASAITTLFSYDPKDVDKLGDRAAQYLSGNFEADYRKYVDQIAAANKQAQIKSNTKVVGAAVETLNGPDATAIVYTNTSSTSPATKDIPSLKYLSYRLTLRRDHARWLVTKMTTITSLDLTPQF